MAACVLLERLETALLSWLALWVRRSERKEANSLGLHEKNVVQFCKILVLYSQSLFGDK